MFPKRTTKDTLKKDFAKDRQNLRLLPSDAEKSHPGTRNSLQALQASETRYRRLFETAQDGILILDAETGQIVDVNPYMVDMLHYSHEEFLGKELWEVSPFKDTVLNRTVFEDLQQKGYIRYKDLPLQTKEGKPVAVEFVSNVYKSNGNKVIQCNIRNITERKEVNQKLQDAVIFQQRLIDALPMPVFYMDVEGRYLGCNHFFENYFGQTREAITGKSLYDVFPKEIADLYQEKNRALLRNPGTQIYETTVKDGGGIVHHVIFHKATFPGTDGSVGGLIGAMLDITNRKRAEEELRENEEKYRTILENIDDGYYEVDLSGNLTFFNDSLCRIHGYPRGELTGMNYRQYADDENSKTVFSAFNGVYKTGIPAKGLVWQIIRKDGSKRYIEASVSLRKNSAGRPIGFRGITRDITERRQSEMALRESEERYRALFDRSLDLVYIYDFEGRFIDANNAALNRLGYKREEIQSMNFASLLSHDQLPLAFKASQEIRENGVQKHLIEFRLHHKNGSEIYVETQGSTVISNGKPVAIQAIARDITGRKRVEESLRVSEEQYRLVIENAKEAIFIVQNMKLIFANDATMAITGYPQEILTSKPFTDFIHPDDRPMVVAHHMKRLKGGKIVPTYSFRIMARDGAILWCELNAAVIQWQGKPATLNFLSNITERKRAEDESKQSFARMRKALGATVHAISTVVELKDPYTSGHQRRVADLSRSIAREMGLSADRQDFIRTSTTIHDIGKIAIPSEILSKPTKLTDLEFNLIKTHAQFGYDILKNIEFPWPVADVVLQHHERMNGSGYPRGLQGNDILLEARILAVSDVVESMASHRPYRPALGIEMALAEIGKNRGILYDVDVVDACVKLFHEKGYRLR